MKYVFVSTSASSHELFQEDCSSNTRENVDSDYFSTLIENSKPGASKSVVIRKDFISPKLVASLDRCQSYLSMRDSVFILETIIDALGFNIDEFPISKSSIQKI